MTANDYGSYITENYHEYLHDEYFRKYDDGKRNN